MQIQATQQSTAVAVVAADVVVIVAPEQTFFERQGCGWFDSSYELRRGLTVTEDIDLSVFQLWVAVAELVH